MKLTNGMKTLKQNLITGAKNGKVRNKSQVRTQDLSQLQSLNESGNPDGRAQGVVANHDQAEIRDTRQGH